jgi:ATP-dependent RNA helicase DDX55/SPB4
MPEVKRVLMQEGTGAAAAAGSKQEPKGLASLPHFTPSTVDPESIRFKDKAREKQRQKLQQQRAQQQAEAEAARAAQKHGKGGASGAPQPAGHKSGERLPAAKRRKLQARDEMAELEADYRLLKKVRRGKLSEHEFDVAAGLSSDSELSSEGMDEGDDGDYKGAAGQVSEAGRQQHPAQAQRKGQAGSGKKKNDRGTGTANGLSGPLATKSSAAGAQAAGSAQQSSKGSLLQQKLASKLKKQKRKQRKQQQQLSAGTAG